MKRLLSLWLTDWSIDRLRRNRHSNRHGWSTPPAWAEMVGAGQAEPPFALTERAARGVRIVAANPTARAAGVAPGLTLADARARLPGLVSEPVDRARDRAGLESLGHWAVRYTPTVALDGDDGLMLDITGCGHLFGGEAGLMADLSGRLDRAGLAHRLGVGPTPGAAWALSHGADAPLARIAEETVSKRALLAALATLPVMALRLGIDALELLHRFGLTRVGQVAELDRAALARRFQSRETADRVLLRLDQALGRIAEPVHGLRPPPEHLVRQACPEPLLDLAGLEAGLARLLARLAVRLADAGLGARRFRLTIFRADGTVDALPVAVSRPLRDPGHLRRLFDERLGQLDPGHGVDLMTLEAEALQPMAEAPRPLVPRGADTSSGTGEDPETVDRLAKLADRLAARLGDDAVRVTQPAESHLPELAERWVGFAEARIGWKQSGVRLQPGVRPVRLLARPEPVDVIAEVPDGPPVRFTWRRIVRPVARADGPERIAPEWWQATPGVHGAPRTRDYFRVEDDEGTRYWIYRDGLYSDEEAPPNWYLHGLFA